MATALWALLCWPSRKILGGGKRRRLGGLLGFSGWLPFARQIEEIIQSATTTSSSSSGGGSTSKGVLVSRFLLETIGHPQSEVQDIQFEPVLSTPVMLSHGTDDGWVDVGLGRQAHGLLTQMGIRAEWREYRGAEGDGHWIKEPEGFEDVVRFLEKQAAMVCSMRV
ncbi:hypothetical protein VTN96DRAFT_2754 [Rasamsonia emersonii]